MLLRRVYCANKKDHTTAAKNTLTNLKLEVAKIVQNKFSTQKPGSSNDIILVIIANRSQHL